MRTVQSEIDNFLNAIGKGVYTLSVVDRLKELEAQKAQLEAELEQRRAPEKMSEQMIWFLSTYIPSDSDTEEYWKDVFSIFLDSVVCFDNGKVVISFNLFDDDPILKNSVKKEVECVLSAECAEVRAGDSQAYEENRRRVVK